MRYRAAVVISLFIVSGCSLGLDVPEGAAIACNSQAECPDDFVCQVSLSRCVPLGYDITPPALTAPPAISPSVVGADAVVTISFDTSKRLGLDPAVSLVFGPIEQRNARLVTKGNDNTHFEYAYTPDLQEPQTSASVVILITDVAGNQGSAETPAAVRFDRDPPIVYDDSITLTLTPPPPSVTATSSALATNGTATIQVQTSEPITLASRVLIDGNDAGFMQSAALGLAYTYTLTYAGNLTDGAHTVTFEAADEAGNTSIAEVGVVVTDTAAPADPAVATGDAVIYRRAPWQGDTATRFTVRGAAGAFEPSALVAVFDSPAAGAALLGAAQADSTGALAPLALPSVDRKEVFVRVYDGAGNSSALLQVLDVEWVGGFDPNGFASPHNAIAFRSLRRGLSTVGALPITPARTFALGAADTDAATHVDVSLGRPWVQRARSTDRPGRFFLAAAYDARREQVVMFGGQTSDQSAGIGSQAFSIWNNGWVETTGAGALPPARFGHVMAYDSARDRVVLHGGQNLDVIFSDTWEWDGANWQPVLVPGPPLTFHAMTYDEVNHRMLAVGGCKTATCSEVTAEVWTFDGTAWTPLATTNAPSARRGHSLTFVQSAPVLFGGCIAEGTFNPAAGNRECNPVNRNMRDRYALNGTTWTNITDGSEPSARSFHAAVFDNADNHYIWGGTPLSDDVADSNLYANDGGGFFVSFDTERRGLGAVAVHHVGLEKTLFFGGLRDDDQFLAVNNEMWFVRYPAFALASSGTWPRSRALGGLAYHPQRRGVVLSGGFDGTGNRGFSTIWDGGAWTELNSNVPTTAGVYNECSSGGGGGQSVYDSFRGSVVTLCGNQAWELQAAGQWATAGSALGASVGGYAAAYDSVARRTLVFGGGAASGTTGRTLYAFSGTAWTTLCAVGSLTCNPPPARRCAGMTYDAARGRTVMFGGGTDDCYDSADGDDSASPRNDTWEWNGSAWTQVCNGGGCVAPPARANAAMVYDTNRARSVLVGLGYGDLWEWDGARWRAIAVEGITPPYRRGAIIGYDPARRVVVMYGGDAYGNPNDELWELDVDSEQRPAVLLRFDWSAAGVPRSRVRSVSVHVRGGGLGFNNDTTVAPDGDTLGEPRTGLQVEAFDTFWQTVQGSGAASVTALADFEATSATTCGSRFLKNDDVIYARVSPLFGAGNGDSPGRLVLDQADVTVRYRIDQTVCP